MCFTDKEKKKITEIVVRNATDKSKIKKLSDDYNKRYKTVRGKNMLIFFLSARKEYYSLCDSICEKIPPWFSLATQAQTYAQGN